MSLKSNLKSAVGKEFELYDINEEIAGADIRHKVAENVAFVLRRERLLPAGHSVIIPVGGDNYEMSDEDELRYEGSFEVFAPDRDTIVAYGRVHGVGLGDVLHEIDVTVTEVTGNVPRRRTAARPKPKSKRVSPLASVSRIRG